MTDEQEDALIAQMAFEKRKCSHGPALYDALQSIVTWIEGAGFGLECPVCNCHEYPVLAHECAYGLEQARAALAAVTKEGD